jgi:phosphoglycerate dehydrogenase-like enzyme
MNVVVGVYSDGPAWTLPRSFIDQLRRDFPQHTFLDAWDADTLRRSLPEAEVAFSAAIDRSAFASLPRLRWVQSPAAGVGGMLGPELVASPVVLTSARGVRARAIAEHVIGVTLALARQLPLALRRQSAHEWALNEIETGGAIRTLHGQRMAIVGLGAIGLEVAKLAAPFGMHVSAVRKRVDRPVPACVEEVVAADRLLELLSRSDVIVLAAPLTGETRELIGSAALARVKRGALLVNVGRGKLLNDAAVIEALKDGRLAGAALDVFAREPLDPASPYWDLPNVIVTPHISGAMEDYWTPLVALFSENLRRFEAGLPLINVIDKFAGY